MPQVHLLHSQVGDLVVVAIRLCRTVLAEGVAVPLGLGEVGDL